MGIAYKLNKVPRKYTKESYGNLIVLNPVIEETGKDELKYRLNSNGTGDYDCDEDDEDIPVQPLIGCEIKEAKLYLLNRPGRYHRSALKRYTLFCFGISVGLRISDLLKLKISKVVKNGNIRDSIKVKEGKNKNKREIFLRPKIKELLVEYINSLGDWKYDYYLFHPRNNYYKQMTRQNVNKIMKDIEQVLNLDVPLGTHSLRKTFARAVFDLMTSKGDMLAIEKLQAILGHKDVSTTRRYIGLQREGNRDIYLDEDLCI